jgi:hypothetical protein
MTKIYVPMQHPKPWQVPRDENDFARALRMRDAGETFASIGAALGVTKQRAMVIVKRARVR